MVQKRIKSTGWLHINFQYPTCGLYKYRRILLLIQILWTISCAKNTKYRFTSYCLTKVSFGGVSLRTSYQRWNIHTLRRSVPSAKCRYTIRKMQHTFIADSLYAVSYTSGPSLYLVLQDFFQAPSRVRSLTVTTNPTGCVYSWCLVFRSIGYCRSNFFKVTIVPMAMNTHKLYYYDKRLPHTK